MKRKTDFIHDKCEMCGKQELSLSTLRLICGYCSQHDGERIVLNICGDCADKIYGLIKKGGLSNNVTWI